MSQNIAVTLLNFRVLTKIRINDVGHSTKITPMFMTKLRAIHSLRTQHLWLCPRCAPLQMPAMVFEINCTSTDNGSTDSIYVYIYMRVHDTEKERPLIVSLLIPAGAAHLFFSFNYSFVYNS
jgi:hypothetical protein